MAAYSGAIMDGYTVCWVHLAVLVAVLASAVVTVLQPERGNSVE